MTASSIAEPSTIDKCFAAVEQACLSRGLVVTQLPSKNKDWLGVSVTGTQKSWELDVDCESDALTRLPSIKLRTTDRLLEHIGYWGSVCVSDNQGLSLDPERREEIVAVTVLAAFDLLEKWSADEAANTIEFYNELEGYWLGLHDSVRARSTVEVDGRNRLIRAFTKSKNGVSKWYFTEQDERALLSFDTKGLAAQRALYIDLPTPIPPPLFPSRLGPEFLVTVRQSMSSEQTELWKQMVGPSKNRPRRLALLLSVPRAPGGRSLVGIAFTAKNGEVDTKGPITPLTVRRFTPTYMRERGGASLNLLDKHIVVIGCGAVGAVAADALATTGVGRLTLVDGDLYSEDNVFRHLIEPTLIELYKVVGLKFQLERRYPGVKVEAVTAWAQEWLRTANFDDIDGIVFAFGLPSLERSFARAIRTRAEKQLPMAFTWLEPLDIGGHSVVLFTEGPGCLDCLYRDDEGAASLAARTAFLEPNQAVSKNLTGCSSVFVPYGALQSRRTGLMAAEHLLSSMNDASPSYRYWVGDGAVAFKQGLRTTPWWEEAKRVTFGEASYRVFGRPCKRCRVPK